MHCCDAVVVEQGDQNDHRKSPQSEALVKETNGTKHDGADHTGRADVVNHRNHSESDCDQHLP